MFSLATCAQDIIVTNDSKKIDAKIVEVSKSEVRYKEIDNLDGPTFVIETKEISSVIYSNGKVVVYTQPSEINQPTASVSLVNAPIVDESTAEILFLSGQKILAQILEMKNEYVIYVADGKVLHALASDVEKVTLLKNGQVKQYSVTTTSSSPRAASITTVEKPTTDSFQTGSRIYRGNGSYIYHGTYISSKEVVQILQNENRAAYRQWKKADGMLISGAIFTGAGLGLAIGSIFPFIYENNSNNTVEIIHWARTGIGLVTAGGVCAFVGVGLVLGASAKYSKAIDIYNSKYDQAAVQLKWNVTPCNVGIALAF